jgi:hypothetical protein
MTATWRDQEDRGVMTFGRQSDGSPAAPGPTSTQRFVASIRRALVRRPSWQLRPIEFSRPG